MLRICLKQLRRVLSVSDIMLKMTIRRNIMSASEFKIELDPIKLHGITENLPQTHIKITKEEALMYYTQMLRIRRVEAAASLMYQDKMIRGFLHLYSGQEAVAVGIKSVMGLDDDVITAYRCHGFALLQGVSIFQLLAELAGRESGECRGKGGSMHLFGHHFYGGNGIVGAHVPVGCGLGLALKYKQSKAVVYTCYGDGAANQGQVYESFNMASLWKLPVVFICENNQYGMGTSAVRSSANHEYYTRGDSALIPGIWVNGMSVLGVREAARYAREWCISGKGPIIIEASTYRYFGHSMSDPGTSYRSRDEIADVRKTRDPITSFRDLIQNNKIATGDELKGIDTNVKLQIDAAVKKALDSLEAPIVELANDIYADTLTHPLVRFKLPDQLLTHKRIGPGINIK